MQNKWLVLFGLISFNLAQAEILGFEVGIDYWQHDISGQIQSGNANIETQSINFDENNDLNVFVVLEHPVPFLPNIKLQQNNINANGVISQTGAGLVSGSPGLLDSELDLSHTDLMLYYELLDNWVNLDLGLSAKYFDGYSRLSNEDVLRTNDYDDLIPLVYAKAQFDLPFTGLSAAATIETISLAGDDVTDFDLALKYRSLLGLGAALGYRVLDVDFTHGNNVRSELKTDGFYLGVYLDF